MYVKDSKFVTPNWNVKIWKYMSLEKFLDILVGNHIYFTNAAYMTDKNECKIPKGNRKQFFSQDEKTFVMKYSDFYAQKRSSFINCWIINRFESYALWKIYLGGAKTGIAIKSNIRNLISSINTIPNPSLERINIGKVDYTNFIKDDLCIEKLITTKNHFYSFENEVRLVILKEPEIEKTFSENKVKMIDGIHVNIDPLILIDEIYVSPFGGTYFKNIIESTIKRISPELANRIKRSEIRDS
jgi:hypothetical protein